MAATPAFPCQAVARHEYHGISESELSFNAGDILTIHQIDESGWSLGSVASKPSFEGWFPSDFAQLSVEVAKDERRATVSDRSIVSTKQFTAMTLEHHLQERPSTQDLLQKNIIQQGSVPAAAATPEPQRTSSPNPISSTQNVAPELPPLAPKPKFMTNTPVEPKPAPKRKGIFGWVMSAVSGVSAAKGAQVTNSRPESLRNSVDGSKPCIFGQSLSASVRSEGEIPIVIQQCVAYLEENGVQEGVFRLSGSLVEVEDLKKKYRSPEDRPDLNKYKEVHTIAVLMKQFFSQLAEPLFTFELFDEWVELVEGIQNHKTLENVPVREIQKYLQRMPKTNRALTKYLMRFLKDFSQHVEKTKMASNNLALVFGPNLLRSKEPTAESLFGMNGSKLVEIMIVHYDAIFASIE
eukprot:TRINITY_DN7302_c0_g1_i1.p1 TRINITY_DN7302_c0_g1~~TRINITY_DN7302_c0_g1_i1.p1  ORF type:complete len:408 (+),score=101.18 TRINITY_DN7302_c0_g1_i1:148-1371(+)